MMHMLDIKRPAYHLPDLTTKEGMDEFLVHLRSNLIIRRSRMRAIIGHVDTHITQALNHVRATTNPYGNFLITQDAPGVLRIIWNDTGRWKGYETTIDLNPNFEEWLDEEFADARERIHKHIDEIVEKYNIKA